MTVACSSAVLFEDQPNTQDPFHRSLTMLTPECLGELQTAWLPNITDAGLDRLIDLLDKGSPLLVHGCFTRTVPMGCLATHAAWNHPQTCRLTLDAGITWLHRVAHLNPATSEVLRAWDQQGPNDFDLRADFLRVLLAERDARGRSTETPRRAAAPLRKVTVNA
jgi:hypothetical protein